jgi:hypothetical protein
MIQENSSIQVPILDEVMERIEEWRNNPKSSRRMPEALWEAAASLSKDALPRDWESIYHHPVLFLETFVDTERSRNSCARLPRGRSFTTMTPPTESST